MTKLTLYGFIAQCMLFNILLAYDGTAQKAKSLYEVNLDVAFESASFAEVLAYIEANTNYVFSYDKSDFRKTNNAITLKESQVVVSDVLMELSKHMNVGFKQINNNIYIKKLKKNEPAVEVVLQAKTVTGQVTADDAPEGLPGVNVILQGTATGTVTDIDGKFTIEVPADNAVLVFSSVGYVQEEVTVGNQSVINMSLIPDITALEEIVVVGYGTTKKKDLTGSVSSLDSKAFEKVPANTFEQVMQGRVAGVQVTQGNAAPGGGVSIRIRGSNSITGNSEPLYVIDGVPVISNNNQATVGGIGGEGGNLNSQNALASLNPNDISNIEILKDASAAAIYGSRGANGVVIITTKKGESGKPKVEFSTYASMQEPVKKVNILSVEDWLTAYREGYTNAGLPQGADDATLNDLAQQGGFDYQEDLFRSGSEAMIQNYQLSVSGLSDQGLNYYVSSGYYSQDGIIKNSGFDRYSLRLNLDKSFDNFRFGNNITLSRTESDLIPTDGLSGVVASAIKMQPILPLYNDEGDFYFEDVEGGGINANPAALIRGSNDQLRSDRLLGSVFAEYEILDGFTFRTTLGLDIDNRSRRVYYDRTTGPRYGGTAQPGFAQQANAQTNQVVTTNMLNYKRLIGDRHNIDLTGVFEAQTYEYRSNSMVNRGFPSDALGVDAISSGQQEGGPNINNNRYRWQLASWVGRAFYSFDDKYLVTVTGRADGSSKFGEDNKWGFFPSVALGWRLSEESFLEGIDAINDLKIRGSWGVTGNQEIGILQTAERLNPQDAAVFGGVFVPSVVVASFSNESLKWEETSQMDLGFDGTFFNNRFNISADYYVKKTNDLLLALNLPVSSGFTNRPVYNLGKVENRGIEIAIGGTPIETNAFSWNIEANFTRNRNEVIEIFSDRIFGPEIDVARKLPGNLVEEGRPIGVFYGYQLEGVYATEQEAQDAAVDQSGVYLQEEGEFIVADTDGDNVITPDDRTVIGNPNPDFLYGINNSLSWKGFSLDLIFQGVQGNDVLWNEGPDQQERFDNRWTPDNRDAAYPKYNENGTQLAGFYDSRLIYDGSFLRLKNISLGYQLPVESLNLIGFSAIRVYVSATNLFTITDYPGYNPDVNSYGQNAINQGIDRGSYPLAKSYTLGVNLSF